MKKNRQTHALLLALVGGYVLYIAYHLFENLQQGASDMAPAAAIAAIAIFGISGVGVLLYALRVYRTPDKEQNDGDDDRLSKQ